MRARLLPFAACQIFVDQTLAERRKFDLRSVDKRFCVSGRTEQRDAA